MDEAERQRRYALLEAFVRVYGAEAKKAIDAYNAGAPMRVCLAEAPPATGPGGGGVRLPPDMQVASYTTDEIAERFDVGAPSVRLLMRQFRSLDPSKQGVVGLIFGKDDVLSHVVHIVQR